MQYRDSAQRAVFGWFVSSDQTKNQEQPKNWLLPQGSLITKF
jgi:hypothetical protein